MRRFYVLGAFLLALAACGSTSSPVTGEFDARVVFDGEACVYDGPTLIGLDSRMTVEFDEGADPAVFVVGHAREGTTWEEVVEYYENSSARSIPPFAADLDHEYRVGSGTLVVPFDQAGVFALICATAPEDTDKGFPAAMIEVVDA